MEEVLRVINFLNLKIMNKEVLILILMENALREQ